MATYFPYESNDIKEKIESSEVWVKATSSQPDLILTMVVGNYDYHFISPSFTLGEGYDARRVNFSPWSFYVCWWDFHLNPSEQGD